MRHLREGVALGVPVIPDRRDGAAEGLGYPSYLVVAEGHVRECGVRGIEAGGLVRQPYEWRERPPEEGEGEEGDERGDDGAGQGHADPERPAGEEKVRGVQAQADRPHHHSARQAPRRRAYHQPPAVAFDQRRLLSRRQRQRLARRRGDDRRAAGVHELQDQPAAARVQEALPHGLLLHEPGDARHLALEQAAHLAELQAHEQDIGQQREGDQRQHQRRNQQQAEARAQQAGTRRAAARRVTAPCIRGCARFG